MSESTYIPRLVDETLDALMLELPALMLTGPRGCGKTTTALRRATSVLRLDHPEQAGAFQAAPDAVLTAQRPPVLVDEWQEVPESLGAVKRAVDASAVAGRYLITGSVRSRESSPGWPATGRVTPLPMYGLTVAEAQRDLRRARTTIARLFDAKDPVPGTRTSAPDLVGYVDHLVRGGFPASIGLSDLARASWFEGYVDQLVRHDVLELAAVRSAGALADLVHAVALNTAGLSSITTLAQAARIDHRTARTYLDLLESLAIIERLPAWSTNRLSRLVRSPKYYIVDPGLAAHLAGDDRAGLLTSADRLGRLIDTFVMAQLRPLLKLASPRVGAFHLRDANGTREVDLILESAAGQVVGIEIKASATVTAKSAKHLGWLRDTVGPRFTRGVVLHSGSMTFPLGDRIWAMPIASLWQH